MTLVADLDANLIMVAKKMEKYVKILVPFVNQLVNYTLVVALVVIMKIWEQQVVAEDVVATLADMTEVFLVTLQLLIPVAAVQIYVMAPEILVLS